MAHQLEIDSVSLQFGSRTILSDVYLKCETGKITGLLGRNGTGKSSLMNLIFGTLVPGNKSVRFDGQAVPKAYQHHELPKKGFLITDHMYQDVIDLANDLYVLAAEKVHLVKDISDLERLGYARSGR
ncbi:ATP-binding cassette domain-containing protein [Pedobacter sp. N36a]|uniref:ATP-binding cassette domain-containing protein n=1 Tax=Pedobacter sp. N36a TaxID=2767996 RepID=UPI001657203C|nr:ATP-binding cassette domain-containing protein [Pedobacter sp. N36a]MBC8984356.1 ATP-binding cassette domain-containing protein [Pedobacter sp. N36a]